MSEEESFVILGSSPPSSLCNGGSLRSAGPQSESNQTSLKIADLREAINTVDQAYYGGIQNPTDTINKSSNGQINTLRSNGSDVQPTSLAASFILGEVNADVLKNSVYSQFPSLCSMQACAEDVVKLQNLMTEYIDLKQTLAKVNSNMKRYYDTTCQWRAEAAKQEVQYQQKLQDCQTQIEALGIENEKLKCDIHTNEEQIKISESLRQKENDELRQIISEKSSLINNMRAQIDKMEQQQLQSFEIVPSGPIELQKPMDFVERTEHDNIIKELKREMSVLVAENFQFNDMQKTYIDEINCLKVNLTSAEELLHKMSADVSVLKAKDIENTEELAYLRQQVDIYRKDFEMERADREKNAGEKEQYLEDLRALQRRNQELIEALAETNRTNRATGPSTSSAAFAKISSPTLRENQRPVLDANGAATETAPNLNLSCCPMCSKRFSTLCALEKHVNDCLEKN